MPPLTPRSALPEIEWPAVPTRDASVMLALQHQLRHSERLPPEQLEALQLDQLSRLLRHAAATVPYYRDRDPYAAMARTGPLTREAWQELPVLTRTDVQDAGSTLNSGQVPEDHRPVHSGSTSGSTGRPVRYSATAVTSLMWRAITLREMLWHRRDFSANLAAIRPERAELVPEEGVQVPGWGPAVNVVYDTGPAAVLRIQTDVARQAEWLVRQDPVYLMSMPTNLFALTQHFRATSVRLPRLRQVLSYGEAVSPNVRAACRQVWDAPLVDLYSSQEIGYMALQCPDTEQYHVQSEVALVEVLDDDGRPCRAGQVGRVVVSPLHNYAMPLLRYDVGDYAEVGGSCPCGRTLPLLARIMGRERNMLRLPTGETVWPRFPARFWVHIEAIRQLQLVQHELDHIEARIVASRDLTPAEESEFASIVRDRLGYPFRVSFRYLEGIDRSRSLKFEEFVSRL